MRRVGTVVALVCALGAISLAPAPAYAAPTVPTVALAGTLMKLADQQGSQDAAVRTADNELVPVEATALTRLRSGSAITLTVVPPATVRTVAASGGTLTVRGPNGRTTSTRLNPQDLAAASDGTPEAASSDLGKATVASAASTGQPLAVSAVISAADPAGTYTPATRRLFVAVVTPKGWSPANAVTEAQINTQVTNTSGYWSTVSAGGVKMSVATITAPYTSAYTCGSPWSLWSEATTRTGFTSAQNTSLVVELPPGASGCGYGLGTVGANVNDDGMLYVSDKVFPVLAHELGHNMSLMHANTLECPSASDSAYNGTGWTGSGCQEVSYDDGTDVMAASRPDYAPFLSSPQSLRTGILPGSAATMVSAAGTSAVTLNALGTGSGVRAAEVVDPSTDVTYYVEYRVATLPDTADIRGHAVGVRVLRFNPADGTTVRLDPTPTATPTTDKDGTLHPGGTFTSYSGAVHITTVSTTPIAATISITRPGQVIPMAASGFTGSSPTRVLDTRAGIGAPTAKLGADATLTLALPDLPDGATAVALNVTATGPTAAGYLTVYPGDATRPTASNLNFVAGQTIPNLVLVPVGPGNTVTFYNAAGTVNVIADLVGSYAP
ncbi:MAG TPA: hypothetical protein VF391_09275 [Dermatophilaceae bacterium]